MGNVINLVGKKFNKLLVLKRINERGNRKQIKWECICDCGNKHIVTGESLRHNKSKSCRCLKHESKNKIIDRELALFKSLYSSTILKISKKKGYKTDIDFDFFLKLVKSKCFYCGIEYSNSAKDYNSYRGIKKKVSDTIIFFNGIDRINSNKGYYKDNVVSCCKHCNTAKNIMDIEVFKKYIKRVYEHLYK